jgi:ABC-type transport system involved in multi-copper enzyme maturation permease subunit
MQFELLRTLTRGRILIWLALAFFPSILIWLLQSQANGNVPGEAIALMTFYLVPLIGCTLGLLLWAAPAIGSELEAQTWIYLAMRPHGRLAVLFGKFAVAVLWTATAGIVSAIGVALCSRYSPPSDLMVALVPLVLLAAVCYGALFTLIGAIFTRRATVIAVVYSLVMEGLVSIIPAAINKLTVCYRLRALLAEWAGLDQLRLTTDELFGYQPAWQHLFALAIYTAIVLLAAAMVVQSKELAGQLEG